MILGWFLLNGFDLSSLQERRPENYVILRNGGLCKENWWFWLFWTLWIVTSSQLQKTSS